MIASFICAKFKVNLKNKVLSMDELELIRTKQAKVSKDNVIIRLREALEMAEEGQIESCAVILVGNDGLVMDCWANNGSPFVMVGAIDALKFDFMNEHIERR